MNNPGTLDRRDVSHPTNPLGGDDHIEETNLAEPLDSKAGKLPAGGNDAAITGMLHSVRNDLPDTGTPHKALPARSGQSAEDVQAAAPDKSNSGRMDQIRADGRDTVHVQSPRPTDDI